MKKHFDLLAAYNAWANIRVLDAAAELGDSDYRRDEKAFFGSIHATLNHILVADRIWMHRFTGVGDQPDRLDPILFDDFQELKEARIAEDQRIIDWTSSMSDQDYNEAYTYVPITSPTLVTTEYSPTVAHFFNHQTHHRGQIHALLTRLSGQAPSLDLVYYLYEQ